MKQIISSATFLSADLAPLSYELKIVIGQKGYRLLTLTSSLLMSLAINEK